MSDNVKMHVLHGEAKYETPALYIARQGSFRGYVRYQSPSMPVVKNWTHGRDDGRYQYPILAATIGSHRIAAAHIDVMNQNVDVMTTPLLHVYDCIVTTSIMTTKVQ